MVHNVLWWFAHNKASDAVSTCIWTQAKWEFRTNLSRLSLAYNPEISFTSASNFVRPIPWNSTESTRLGTSFAHRITEVAGW